MKPGIVIILFPPDLTHLNKVLSGIEAENLPIILVDNSPEPLVDTFSTEITYLHFPSNIKHFKFEHFFRFSRTERFFKIFQIKLKNTLDPNVTSVLWGVWFDWTRSSFQISSK